MKVPQTDRPGFLVFSGANDRAVIALCRAFEKYDVPFGLIARGDGDLLGLSKYADRFIAQRKSEVLDIAEVIHAAREGQARFGPKDWVVCATSEYLNLRLFEFRAALARERITVATCEAELYSTVTSKHSFREYCHETGIDVPTIKQDGSAQHLGLPFVAKPRTNLSANGRILYPFLVRSEDDRRRFLQEAVPEEFYLEDFITGESWYLLYYFASDGTWSMGAQRNLLQQGHGKSIVLAKAVPYPDADVTLRMAERLKQDGYRGAIMVELKRTTDGRSVAIEANPRCWGPFQLTLDANMGLAEAFLRDYGYTAVAPLPRVGVFYGWFGGMVKAIRSGQGLDGHGRPMEIGLGAAQALFHDVYGRRGSWKCFLADLCR